MEEKEKSNENSCKEIKARGKRALLRGLLIFLVIVSVIVLSLGVAFPGLLWSRNLGVKYSQADYESVMNKLNYTKDETLSTGETGQYEYVYSEVSNIDVELTSGELTAFFNEGRPSNFPLKNVQIKINDDNTIEATVTTNVDYALKEFLGNRYTREQIKQEIAGLDILPENVNLYLKFNGFIINNLSNINLILATVQGIYVPDEYVKSSEVKDAIAEGLNQIMNKFNNESGASFDSVTIEGSRVLFKGKLPATLIIIR